MPRTPRLRPGDVISRRHLIDVNGEPVSVPAAQLVHLQFRRFAGCPVCSLHLRSFVRRHGDVAAAGVREVVVFHSAAEDLRRHVADLPFAVIADPEKTLYAGFAVEASLRSLLDPRTWLTIVHAIAVALIGIVRDGRPVPPVNPQGGRWGLPADFLIAPDGRVLACKYGEHADDHWSVDELLAAARSTSTEAITRNASRHQTVQMEPS